MGWREAPVPGCVGQSEELTRILATAWPLVLDQVRDAVIVMDRDRILRFVNDHARRLLGYEQDEVLGARCRLTTQGIDCECACPLTFALEHELDTVRDFSAVYRTKAGQPVPLNVTILPLRDESGEFVGAVEVLRPTLPTLGFYLAGTSELVGALRRRVSDLARGREPVLVVGEAPACADVARDIHRLSGLGDELYYRRREGSNAPPPWPPGTVYVDADDFEDPTGEAPPEGWRLVAGVRARVEPPDSSWALVELPDLVQRSADLPLMISVWVDQLSPGTKVSAAAASRLSQQATELGLTRLAEVLTVAVAAANGEVREEHLPEVTAGAGLVEDVLGSARPLESLEAKVLLEVLERHGWRMQDAADRLGMSRVTLWRKLREHGIQRPVAG